MKKLILSLIVAVSATVNVFGQEIQVSTSKTLYKRYDTELKVDKGVYTFRYQNESYREITDFQYLRFASKQEALDYFTKVQELIAIEPTAENPEYFVKYPQWGRVTRKLDPYRTYKHVVVDLNNKWTIINESTCQEILAAINQQ